MLVHLGLGPSLALARILQAAWRALYEGLHAVRNIQYMNHMRYCAPTSTTDLPLIQVQTY